MRLYGPEFNSESEQFREIEEEAIADNAIN